MSNITQKVLSQGYSVASALSTYKGLAVMLVDMQKSFISEVHEDEALALYKTHSNVITELCAENFVPLINIMYTGSGPLNSVSRQHVEMAPIVKRHMKSSPNAFEKDSRLYSTLMQMQIDTIFIMGIYASLCVLDTAVGAGKKDFKVITADDVIANSFHISCKTNAKLKDRFTDDGITYYDSHLEFLEYLKDSTSQRNL